jgi:hypothetical protein
VTGGWGRQRGAQGRYGIVNMARKGREGGSAEKKHINICLKRFNTAINEFTCIFILQRQQGNINIM